MATRYIVEVEMRTVGDFERQGKRAVDNTKKLDQKWREFGRSVATVAGNVGRTFVGAMDAAVGKAAQLTKWAAVLGGGALLAGATAGVTKFNSELESSQISLAAIFRAHGIVDKVPEGIEKASQVIKDMRVDAQKLPGEFEDLLRIFTTAAVPAFMSGMNPDEWRALASQVMATAKAVSMPMDQAAREFAMLLEGRSGAHNVFGMRLLGLSGDKAQAFNQKDSAERLKIIRTELDKYGESIDVFATSFDGLSSTFKDSAKEWIRLATEPLFRKIKESLGDVNAWFDDNKLLLEIWAERAGEKLVEAFDWAKKKIEEWWPVVRDFASRTWDRLKEIWKELAPHVERAAEALKAFMKDPAAVDKLITLAKLYVAIKAGQAGASMFAGTGQMVASGVQLASAAGGAGGLAGSWALLSANMAKLTTVLSTAVGGVGTGLTSLSAGSGSVFGVANIGAAGVLAPLAAGVAGTVAQFQGFMLVAEATEHVLEGHKRELWTAQKEATRFVASLDESNASLIALRERYNELDAAGDELGIAMLEAAEAARLFAIDAAQISKDRGDKQASDIVDPANKAIAQMFLKQWDDNQARAKEKDKKKRPPKHGGGHGGTHIQKVEIVVTSNQDPSRIARQVFDVLAMSKRNRRSSPHVKNFSAGGTL